MLGVPGLVRAANHSFVDSYRKLVTHTPGGAATEFGGVFAFASGLPLSLFNGCVLVRPATAKDLDAAFAWIEERDVPYRVWIDELRAPGLGDVVLARGLVRDADLYPGMVLHPVPEPPSPAPGVLVVPVSEAGLDEHLGVRVAGGMPAHLAELLFSASFAADPDVAFFTVRLDGRPVGVSLAIRSGDVGGVYAVGSLPDARRRGVGTAATWACVTAGRPGDAARSRSRHPTWAYPSTPPWGSGPSSSTRCSGGWQEPDGARRNTGRRPARRLGTSGGFAT